MATETERLVVQLEARLTQYEKDLKKAGQQTDRATRDIERRFDRMAGGIGTSLKTLAGTLGVALSGAAFVGMIRNSLALADQLEDTADALGLTTTELQALRYAALEAGLSYEKLDSALDIAKRRLGDAVSGGKEAQAMFAALGVQIYDAQGRARGFAPVLQEVTQRIAALSNETEKNAAANDFFGRSGARMTPFLNELAVGWDALAASATEAGRVMSEETITTLAAANKELERLGQTLQVVQAEIVVFAAAMAKALPDAVRSLGLEKMNEYLAGAIATGKIAATFLPPLTVTPPEGPTYRPQTGGGAAKSDAFGSAVEQIQERTRALAAETEAIKLSTLEGQRLTAQLDLQAAATKAGLELDEQRLALIYETADALAQQVARSDFAKAIAAAEQRTAALRQEIALVGQNAEQTQRLKTETELLNAARAAGLPITTELRAQIAAVAAEEARVTEQLRVATEELEKQQSLAEDLEGIFGQAFDRVGNAITEAFAKGESAAIDFGNIGKAIIADLTSSFIKMAAQAAASWLAGFLMPGGGGASPGAINTVLSSTPYGTYHRGGLVGQPSGRRRADPGVFAGAQRFHGGGMPGLRPGEVPAILQKGELVLPRALVAALGGARSAAPARPVQVNVINNAAGTEARQEQRSDGLGGTTIDVTIDRIVADKAGRPGSAVHRALRTQGVRAPLVRR